MAELANAGGVMLLNKACKKLATLHSRSMERLMHQAEVCENGSYQKTPVAGGMTQPHGPARQRQCPLQTRHDIRGRRPSSTGRTVSSSATFAQAVGRSPSHPLSFLR